MATKTLKSVNPATQEVVGELPISTKDEVKGKVSRARNVLKRWKDTPIRERAKYFRILSGDPVKFRQISYKGVKFEDEGLKPYRYILEG
jgi:hypothetical protein